MPASVTGPYQPGAHLAGVAAASCIREVTMEPPRRSINQGVGTRLVHGLTVDMTQLARLAEEVVHAGSMTQR